VAGASAEWLVPSTMTLGRLVGKRPSLRAIRADDLVTIEPWYEEAARAAFEDRQLDELQSDGSGEAAGLLAIERESEHEPIGLLDYEVRDGWLIVRLIALAKAYRGWGYGSEAVRLLEEWAVQEKLAQRFLADVSTRNGLGLYFWLRLGYRPAGRGECPVWHFEEPGHSMAMIRVVSG
jgi:RimJ/RimL family protein N-acetyltransferase